MSRSNDAVSSSCGISPLMLSITAQARATTAGESFSDSAIRVMVSAAMSPEQFCSMILVRWFFGGMGSSNTMSNRRMNAGSIWPMAFDTQKAGTGFSSRILFIQPLRDCAGLFLPKNGFSLANTSSTSSKNSMALRLAKKF